MEQCALKIRVKIKASIPISWVSMPEIRANVPRHQDQNVCYYRQMTEIRTMCLESEIRAKCFKSRKICKEISETCLISRQMCTKIRTSVPEKSCVQIQGRMPITRVSSLKSRPQCLEIKIRVSVITDRCQKQEKSAWYQD